MSYRKFLNYLKNLSPNSTFVAVNREDENEPKVIEDDKQAEKVAQRYDF